MTIKRLQYLDEIDSKEKRIREQLKEEKINLYKNKMCYTLTKEPVYKENIKNTKQKISALKKELLENQKACVIIRIPKERIGKIRELLKEKKESGKVNFFPAKFDEDNKKERKGFNKFFNSIIIICFIYFTILNILEERFVLAILDAVLVSFMIYQVFFIKEDLL